MGNPEVTVVVDGKIVRAKASFKQDFHWDIPFRGVVRGIGQQRCFEFRSVATSREQWFKATLTQQRDDGRFKATVEMPDGKGGVKEVDYPAIAKENIREAHGQKRPLVLPNRSLNLCVPQSDPLHATLAGDDGELLTHHFARYSPAPKQSLNDSTFVRSVERPSIKFSVSKDRQQVTTEVGHTILNQFLTGQVFGLTNEVSSALKKEWTIRLGPFAEHKIRIEKKHKSSKLISLSVDGDLLAESTAEDLESPEGHWACQFRFVGERSLDWEVHESDENGRTLDSTGLVHQPMKFGVSCMVYFEESLRDLSEARLYIDGNDFTELLEPPENINELGLCLRPEALEGSYSLRVPYKCRDALVHQSLANSMLGLFGGIFAVCHCNSSESSNDLVVDVLPSNTLLQRGPLEPKM